MNVPILPRLLLSHLFKWMVLALTIGIAQNKAKALTVNCPDDVVIQLGVHACGTIVALDELDFHTTVTLVDTVFFPETNSSFPIGTTPVTMATADINGNLDVCIFNVTVLDYLGPNVFCKPTVSLPLGGDCEHTVLADEILELDFNGCADNFILFRIGQNNTTGPPVITAFDLGSSVTIRAVQPVTGKSCETVVNVIGGTPPSFTCPPNITIICNTPSDSAYTGAPILSGCFQDVDLSYTDQLTPAGCPDSFAYQIVRHWKATDPFGKTDFCNQIITAKKFNVNLVTFPPNRDGIEAPALICNDTLEWEMVADPKVSGFPVYNGFSPDLSPHCKISVTYLDFETNICGASYEIRRVWKVVKICAPFVTLQDTQIIKILDPNPPVFELPDSIYVSQSMDCDSFVFLPPANIISECSGYDILIETPWDTLNTNGGVIHFDTLIEGNYPIKYILTDVCGNVGEKEPIIVINHETLVNCPPDTTVNCDYFNDTLNIAVQTGNAQTAALVGNPFYYANCGFTISEVDSVLINSCGVGTLKRFLTNSNASNPVTCVQNVYVTPVSDFEVLFPEDVAICTTLAAGNTGQPVLFNISCENIVVDHADDITLSSIPGCFTVHRTFMVKNTCTFNGNTAIADEEVDVRRFADGGDGYVEYTQVIEVNNTTGPTFPNGCSINDVTLPNNACLASITIPTPVSSGCRGNPTLQVSGDLGTTLGATVPLFPGSYNVVYTATDVCGKTKTCSTEFEVLDITAPHAKCKSPFTIEPLTALTPFDIDNSSFDNCTGLYYSFAKDSLDELRVFPCCANGLYSLTLWVTDPVGNQDSCHTFVLVDPGNVVCICDVALTGHIFTEENEGVANVKVSVSSNGTIDSVFTDASGGYIFNVLPGQDYALSPYKNTGPLNGVTTFDGVLITKQILGVAQLDSPYKIIAADINHSNTVTTFDMVEMRRLILGITTSFPNNTSWRFVPANFVFPNPLNPFQSPFPETININNPQMNMPNLNFIAIKVGDVNSSADPFMINGFPTFRDAQGTANLMVADIALKEGETYQVPISMDHKTIGFQFALLFNPEKLELLDIKPLVGTLENYVLSKEKCLVKASWFSPQSESREAGTAIFSLTIKAKKDGHLYDCLQIGHQEMPAETYLENLEILQLALQFDNEKQLGGQLLELFPAKPNPFNKSTVIAFQLPESGEISMLLSDISGKTIWNKKLTLESGRHEAVINKYDLPGVGTYIFKLETPFGTRFQKIILHE